MDSIRTSKAISWLLHMSLVLLIMAFQGTAYAIDYYVDSTSLISSDYNNGMSPTAAWKTISKVNTYGVNFLPGDNIYLMRGSIWKEKLIFNSSGIQDLPITYSAYGEGPKPLLDGLTDVTQTPYQWALAESLSDETKKVWYLSQGYSSAFSWWAGIYEKSGNMTRMAYRGNDFTAGQLLNNHDFARISYTPDHGSWTFYVRADEGRPSTNDIRIYLAKNYATLIDTNGHDHMVIDNLAVRGGNTQHGTAAILIRNSSYVTIQNSEVYFSKVAIGTSSSSEGSFSAMHCVIKNNNIHDNNEDGIYLKMNSSYNIISNNTVHHNYDMGKGDMVGDNLAIGISGSNDASNRTGNIIEYNSIYENGSYDEPQTGVYDNSISLYQVSNTDVRHNYIYRNKQGAFYAAYNSFNTSFYYNIVHRNHVQNGRLLFLGGNDNLSIYNNTVYENTLEATTTAPYNINSWRLISVEGPANNSTISNNIFAGNRMLTKTGYPAYLVRLGNSTTTVDYNIYYDNLSEDEVGNSLPLWHSTLNGTCPTLEMWNSLGYDLSSNKDNPRFINAVDSDFQIRPDSSAINAGIYIGIDSDIAGMSIEGSPDIGAHEYGAINTPYWEKNKYGSVSGSYVNTIYSDNAYEEITEATKNNGAFSQLQHKWQFDITGPQKATFYLRAHHTENSEGDHFIFSYKPSGTKVYIEMIEVKGTTPDDTYQTFQFPDNLTGTVTIQVKDTNRERSNRKLDTLYIEHMVIQSR